MIIRRILGSSLNHIRCFQISSITRGTDARDKRIGHLRKVDKVEGEHGAFTSAASPLELIDENLMDRVFGSAKFKDIPVLHLICTRNNTKMVLTDGRSKIYCLKSAGTEGFKNCRKGTTVAAQAVANRVVTYAKDHEFDMIRLVFDGLGPGRNAAYKVVELSGLKVVSLSDRTEAIEPWIKRPRGAKSL